MGKAPDKAEADRLMLEHLPAALSFATKLTGSADAAEELVQSALLRAAAAIGGYRGEATFKTWLFRIIINCFRDSRQHRSRREAGVLPEDLADSRSATPLGELESVELEQRVALAVSRLPGRQREVLILHAYEQIPTGGIAHILDTTEANVRKNLQLARDRLRIELAADLDEVIRGG